MMVGSGAVQLLSFMECRSIEGIRQIMNGKVSNIFVVSHEVYSAMWLNMTLVSSLSRYTRLPLMSRSCRRSVGFSEVVLGKSIEVKEGKRK